MTTAPVAVGGVVSFTVGGKAVSGCTNGRLSFGPTLVDVTELSVTYMTRFPTITDWTYTIDLVFDSADEGQAMIKTYVGTATRTQIAITITGGSLTGYAWLESIDFTWDPKEVQRATCTFKGSGALAFGA